jgi:hypothetical protein
MDTLLVIAVVLITLAILVQAGVLTAMYLMSRKLADNVNDLLNDSRKLMTPLESAADNLKTASEDVVELERSARHALMRPVRWCSAVATGVTTGLRTLIRGRVSSESQNEREHPAA